MSTLSVSSIQNASAPQANISLNADGSVTLPIYTSNSAPLLFQPGTLWYDTAGPSLVIRNTTNTAWVSVATGGGGTITGVTATAPLASTGGTAPVISIGLGLGTAVNGSNIAVSIPVASTAPTAGTGATQALNGSLYWDDGVGALFIRYNNGGTPTWVQAAGSSNVITTNATYYVATTGNDTTGNGSATAPWATPHKAMEYLSAFVIKQGVTVTVSVADGTYTFTTPLNLNHPNGSQIFINGGTTSGARPTTSLTGGNAVGNTGATLAANDTLLNAYYNTKWQFNGCSGLICDSGGNVTVNTVLIRGNAAAGFTGVAVSASNASSGGINLGTTVAVHNFGNAGLATSYGGSIVAGSTTVTNSGTSGVATNFGGSIFFVGGVTNNNTASGIQTGSGGSINASTVVARYNGGNGISTSYGGEINAQGATASNNGGVGIGTNAGGSINAQNAIASGNGGGGVNLAGIGVYNGGNINANGATASNNTGNGFRCDTTGVITAVNATALTNTSTNVLAVGMAYILFTGGSAAGSLSPVANTIGNNNSFISV